MEVLGVLVYPWVQFLMGWRMALYLIVMPYCKLMVIKNVKEKSSSEDWIQNLALNHQVKTPRGLHSEYLELDTWGRKRYHQRNEASTGFCKKISTYSQTLFYFNKRGWMWFSGTWKSLHSTRTAASAIRGLYKFSWELAKIVMYRKNSWRPIKANRS